MRLLASLGLKPPKNFVGAGRVVVDTSAVSALQADLKAAMRDSIAYASQLKQPAAKVELIGALKVADADRRKAESVPGMAAQVQALKAALATVRAATEKARRESGNAKPVPAAVFNGANDAPLTLVAAPGDPTAPAQPKAAAAASTDDAKAAVLALRAKLEADQKKAYGAWAPLADEQAALAKEIATAQGGNRTRLESIKKDVDRRAKEADLQLKQISADVEALDDPLVKRATYTAILARHKAGVVVGKQEEVDKHDLSLDKKRLGNSKETRTGSEYAGGKAVTTTAETATTLGLGGASKTKTTARETVTASGTQKSEQSETAKVSLGGLAYEKSVKGESEKGGKTRKAERKTSAEVGPGGASVTDTRSRTNADGSGSASSTTTGVERGDGKIAKVTFTSRSETDASGTTTTTGQKTKGGMIAGKDGHGAFAQTDKSYERKSAGGVTTGAVAGLNANVVCNVTAVKDSDPLLYELSMTISFGASVGASKGHDKEGATEKAKVSVHAAQALSMKRTYRLGEKEAKVYVDSLKAASKGGTVGATQKEFAIIRTGVAKSWDEAYKMFVGGQSAELKAGESREATSSTSAGVEVGANVKAVGVEVGVQVDRERSTKETMGKDGNLAYETKASESTKKKGKLALNMGVVGGSMGGSHTHATSTGLLIVIDPKAQGAKAMQRELDKCGGPADYDAFAAKYPDTVREKTASSGEADTQSVGMAIAGVGAELELGNSLDTTVTTDGHGKLKRKKVVGGSNRGGSVSVGGFKISGGSKEQIEATTDGEGNTTADLTRADTSTDWGKLVKAHNPFNKDKKKAGLLAKATGGAEPEDTDSREVYGLRLTNADLDRLGQMACQDWNAWMKGTMSPKARPDWEKAGKAVKKADGERGVVAEQLATFIASDKSSRLASITYWLRPDGRVATGTRYEFPDALASSKASYETLVVDATEAALEAMARKDGPQKAAAAGKVMLDTLDALYKIVEAFKGFSQPAVRAEMMSAINARKEKVLKVLRAIQGQAADAVTLQEKTDSYHRILKACVQYEATQNESFEKIDGWYRPGSYRYAEEIIAELKQIRDLHAIWWRDYREAAALGKEIGKLEATYSKFQPNVDRLDKTEHKVRIQG